jgi:hypothetical protein
MIKIKRILEKKFADKKEFQHKLDPERKRTVNADRIRDFIIESCPEEIQYRKIDKKDVEAFMSSFVYNKQGATKSRWISELVFS